MTVTINITEAQWQEQVLELAQLLGWRHMHVRRSIGKGRKWTTATNVTGWPDLTLWKPGCGIVFLELKSETGSPTPEQLDVLADLAAGDARTMVARPSQVDAVVALLKAAER